MNDPFLINSFDSRSPFTINKKKSKVCTPWQLPYHNISACSDMLLKLNAVKSNQPSRHIALYSKHLLVIGHHDLFKSLRQNSGEIRAIYPYVSAGITIISYYNLQDAQIALQLIQKKYDANTFEACFAKPCLINKNSNERVFITICSNNPQINLNHFDYMKYLTRIGTIYSISEANIAPNFIVINLEYHDERDNIKLLAQLNYVTVEGVQFNVYIANNDGHVCDCNKRLMAAVQSPLVTPLPTPLPTPITTPGQTPFPTPTTSKTSTDDPLTDSDNKEQTPCPLSPPQLNQSDKKPKKQKKAIVKPSPVASESTSETAVSKGIQEEQQNGNDIDMDRVNSGLDKRTTFMIRNIPNKYTQKMLIDCINTTHANSYDFLYLRIDFQNKCNVGYAFINFIDPKSAISFAKERVGKKWKLFNSDKRCSLSYANIQGKDALVRKFKNSHVMAEDAAYQPKLFYSSGLNRGKEQAFPKSSNQKKDQVIPKSSNQGKDQVFPKSSSCKEDENKSLTNRTNRSRRINMRHC